MKASNTLKVICVMLAVCLAVCGLAACSAKVITVSVNDGGTKTPVEIETGKTVADALEAARITLGAKDITEPAADTQITEDITEIVVKRYAKVTVVKDGEEKTVELVGGTVEDALKAAGIVLIDGEEPDTDPKSLLKDGMTIGISKEVKVSVTADGETKEILTKAGNVEALLKEAGITLGVDDEVSEKLDAKLADGMKIIIKRVEYKEETKTETVDYQTKEEYSDSMTEGTSEVTQNGVEGEKTVTYKVKYVDGKEENREKTAEKVTKKPVDKIVTYGTASAGKQIVSMEPMPDCDADGHGTYIVTYDDGSVEFQVY